MRDYYPCIKKELEKYIIENKSICDLIHNDFCSHTNLRGKYKNKLCLNKSKNKNKLCIRHDFKELKKCSGINNRNKPCNRNIKKTSLYCNYCIKKKSKIYNIEKNIYKLKIFDFNKLNNQITKYFNIKEYIYNLFLKKIINFLYKYNISLTFFIELLKLLIMLSENDKNNHFYPTSNISLEELNRIDCVELMKFIGYSPVREGSRIRFENSNFNIVITNNILFFDNKTRYGNIGAINLYKHITKKNIIEVIKELKKIWIDLKNKNVYYDFENNGIGKKNKINFNNIVNKNSTVPKLYLQNIDNVKKYLINYRKLDKNIIEDMINNGMIGSDKYNNCVFYKKNKKTAFLRSSNPSIRFFKATGIMDFIVYNFGDGPLYIFESPIDCISYYQLYKSKGIYASTNGSTLINVNKIKDLIDNYNKYKITYLCFDNDKAGHNFTEKIKNNINKSLTRLIPKNKDWNDDLIKSNLK